MSSRYDRDPETPIFDYYRPFFSVLDGKEYPEHDDGSAAPGGRARTLYLVMDARGRELARCTDYAVAEFIKEALEDGYDEVHPEPYRGPAPPAADPEATPSNMLAGRELNEPVPLGQLLRPPVWVTLAVVASKPG